jgi:hypothetical protein
MACAAIVLAGCTDTTLDAWWLYAGRMSRTTGGCPRDRSHQP